MKIKCPKCKSTNVQHVGGKVGTSINLNPLKPLTVLNHKPKWKQDFICNEC